MALVQGGYFTSRQALEAGYSTRLQHYHAHRGHWERKARGIYRLPEYPPGRSEDLVLWTLWSRGKAVVSHESAAAVDLGDFFMFQVGACRELALRAGPVRAYRYPVTGMLGGRTFETFHVDAGIGDPVVGSPVDLPGTGLLDFAGLPPVTCRAVSPEQQFAEKLHAMTLPREGIPNSRTHDLADLMLLLDLGLPGPGAVRLAVDRIFETRRTHPVPSILPDPPASWREEFPILARDLALAQGTLDDAMRRLRDAWQGLGGAGT
jgi:hypothetical protein